MRLQNKIALVTGGSRGIGQAVVERFAKEGALVISGDIITPAYNLPENVTNVHLDVTSEDDWKSVVAGALHKHGKLDILVNNAGYMTYEATVHELELEAWNRLIALLQTGVFLGTREVISPMLSQRSGSIVNMSSMLGNIVFPGAHAYHAAKAAVRHMTKNVAVTYAAEGIRANSVHPGIIDTPLIGLMEKEMSDWVVDRTPMKRMGRTAEVANAVLFLASDEAGFVTGAELAIDGGYAVQ
jgi:NAD(P)-dependent dehydrogenase (short-subunit alcohol dehydrogenase family)